MNVLGTPPAFILSQDQTLKILYLMYNFRCTSNLISSLSVLLFYFFTFRLKELSRFLSSTLSVSILCALYFLSLFNFQGPSPPHLSCDSSDSISHTSTFVNTFFHLFFIFFTFVKCVKPSVNIISLYGNIIQP